MFTLVDLLAWLPATHPQREFLVESLETLEAALRSHQSESGLFHTVVLDPSTYAETAGSALIITAMARGVRDGLFGPDTVAAVCLGMAGLMDVLVRGGENDTSRVEVAGTSIGTNPIAVLYPVVPTQRQVTYGVGAWLMAASAAVDLWLYPTRSMASSLWATSACSSST